MYWHDKVRLLAEFQYIVRRLTANLHCNALLPSVFLDFSAHIDFVNIPYITVNIMGSDRTIFCDLCQRNIKPRGYPTHRKACEKNEAKRAQESGPSLGVGCQPPS